MAVYGGVPELERSRNMVSLGVEKYRAIHSNQSQDNGERWVAGVGGLGRCFL